MLQFRRPALLLMAAASLAAAQPALTTIQDILYRANGTRFTGTMFIRYNSFLAGDTSNIATANLTLAIVNGVLNVKLVPTTTATPGAQYNITYNSGGAIQFTEAWAVPPSALTLRVRDVRVSSGSVVGPPPVVSPVQIGDVVGLSNALAVRPAEGVGFAIGRAAVINQAGQIDGAAGSLGDCVRVDGSSGPCAAGGGLLPSFSDGETPGGAVDGINTAFTLNFSPSPAASLALFRNGVLTKPGSDYSISGASITFFLGSVPQPGDALLASYRYANPANPLGTLTAAQVICSSVGASTSAAALTPLATCTIPAGLLGAGDRIEVQFQYTHTGAASGFTGELHWGSATVLSRVSGAAETAFAGRLSFGISAGAQSWATQSWGNSLVLANSVGTAGENTALNLTISLRGQMSGATTDTLALSNFTVVRFPAQLNP
jgi:hypothetical protein